MLDYQWLPAVPNDTPPDRVVGMYVTRVLPYALPLIGLLAASVVGLSWDEFFYHPGADFKLSSDRGPGF